MHNTHFNDELARALIELVGLMNSARQDDLLIHEAGVSLDRALFPLLVKIGMAGAIGVVELADLAGRDHSTVSRQVAKLESLGLVTRQPGATDRRVREAVLTEDGLATVKALSAARRRLMDRFLAPWPDQDRADIARLLTKLTQTMKAAQAGN